MSEELKHDDVFALHVEKGRSGFGFNIKGTTQTGGVINAINGRLYPPLQYISHVDEGESMSFDELRLLLSLCGELPSSLCLFVSMLVCSMFVCLCACTSLLYACMPLCLYVSMLVCLDACTLCLYVFVSVCLRFCVSLSLFTWL